MRGRALLRPERLFLVLVVTVTFVNFISLWHLPVPVPIQHPGFDSSSILSSPRSTLRKKKKQGVCNGYNGILHIRSGDYGAAAGTVFFIYVLNQLMYAEQNQLLPWIHLNNISKHVYDPIVHGGSSPGVTTFEMMHGMTVPFVSDGYRHFGFGSYAGPPKKLLPHTNLTTREYQVTGTGVWNHYFQPVSDFDPTTVDDCRTKPLIRMHYYHLNPSMLFYCPWSLKSWPYDSVVQRLAPNPKRHAHLKDWFRPMRQKGHALVQKYIRFQPHIVDRAEQLLGNTTKKKSVKTNATTTTNAQQQYQYQYQHECLALHIRHSDKGGTNRKQIPLESFEEYAKAYVQAGGSTIVVATDSLNVLKMIDRKWSKRVSQIIRRQSDDIFRSADRKAIFALGVDDHDRTNTEVLVDILAMSKCQFLVHGFSAVSEAVMYLNFDLQDKSVDLENHPMNNIENGRMTPPEFEDLVRQTLSAN